MELLNGHRARCFESFRMYKDVFKSFCNVLKEKKLFKNSKFLSVEEQVGMFLFVVGNNEGHCIVAERFQHSISTTSDYFRKILRAICHLGKEIIVPPLFEHKSSTNLVRSKILSFFFKNCIGAHVAEHVPTKDQIPWRGRKIQPTQNVMCACSFDMRFTYVMAGWEGTENDARILLESVSNPEIRFPMPPHGKYYLVDSGYTNMPGFLSPYRGERYHLSQYRLNQPRGPKELFNHRHSSLRNVIERCFGVLKARFPILKRMPPYDLSIQQYIVIACCTIHNFIRTNGSEDIIFDAFEEQNSEGEAINEQVIAEPSNEVVEFNITQSQLREMACVCVEIA